jgi:flagellar hook-associated protein 2
MSVASFSGMFSGLDTDALVNATMAAEQAPMTRLKTQQTSWQNKIAAMDNITGPMTDLQDLLAKIKDILSLRAVTATSSDSNSVQVAATSGATEGTHQVVIGQLASAERQVQAGVDPTEAWTSTAAVASGTAEYLSADDISDAGGTDHKFVFQFGTEAKVTVDLAAYDTTGITLNQLVSEINSAAGYTAATAVESSGQYKLRIQAHSSGSGHALTITDDNSVAALDAATDFTRTVSGDTGTDSLVGAGTFVYTYNGTTRTITTTANTTLGQLRDLINNDGANPGVTASVLDYAGSTGGRYHLVLSGQDTGADYTIQMEAATTLSGFGPGAGWTRTQAAQNSRIRVDGYPEGAWIENSGNVVDSAIPGVTLTLLKPTMTGQAMTASSSNSSVLAAWASEGALPGTHEIEVHQLAAAGRQVHTAGLASADSTVGAGQFEYQYNGVTRSVTAGAETTLTQLADLINDDGQNPGVTASVLQYGGQYHLVLDGQDTGSAYNIAITEGTTLTGFQAGDFSATAARNAQFKVNGFPPGAEEWIERGSNTIDDAVPGATVSLQGLGTAQVTIAAPQAQGQDDSITVNLSRDTNQLHLNLSNLASMYNAIADRVKTNSSYDTTTQTAGVLIGDSNLQLLLSGVRGLLSTIPPGFNGQDDTFSMVSQVGLVLDKEGHLSLDETIFNDAVTKNYESVLKLLGDEGVGATDTSFVQFDTSDTTTAAGAYEVQVDFDAAGAITGARIRKQGEGDDAWRAATVDGSKIIGSKGQPEQWLELTATADPSKAGTAYTQNAVVEVKRGFAGAMYQQFQSLLDPTTGPLAIKKTRYQAAVTDVTGQITREQARLDKMEKDLKAKYARMEAALAQLDNMRGAVSAMTQSLNNSSSNSSNSSSSSS